MAKKEMPQLGIVSKFNKWVRTNNAQGLEPTFDITCPEKDCNGAKMILRNSVLSHQEMMDSSFGPKVPIVKVMYKCPICDHVDWYYIGPPYIDNKYWAQMLTWRKNRMIYIPPKDEWEENEIIKERLAALGYW